MITIYTLSTALTCSYMLFEKKFIGGGVEQVPEILLHHTYSLHNKYNVYIHCTYKNFINQIPLKTKSLNIFKQTHVNSLNITVT